MTVCLYWLLKSIDFDCFFVGTFLLLQTHTRAQSHRTDINWCEWSTRQSIWLGEKKNHWLFHVCVIWFLVVYIFILKYGFFWLLRLNCFHFIDLWMEIQLFGFQHSIYACKTQIKSLFSWWLLNMPIKNWVVMWLVGMYA